MLRSTLTWVLVCVAAASCTRTPDNPPVVTAPMGSAAPLSAAPFDAGALSAQTPASDGAAGATDTGEGGASAQFRACQVDSDCVAVQRVGCCHNGWLEAVATSQQGAYTHSFVCPKPHPCPMYVVRDTRVPKCDADTHLCTMVRTQQP